jgi:hypothetical protein
MKDRRGQGILVNLKDAWEEKLTCGSAKRDGKEWYEPGPHSEEMRVLSKKFGMLHGISSLLNLATIISAIAYGFTLGSRLQSIVDKV